MDRVAEAIVQVVQEEIAPELSIPRWISPLQAFRVLTPPLYRWGVRRARDMGLSGTRTPGDDAVMHRGRDDHGAGRDSAGPRATRSPNPTSRGS